MDEIDGAESEFSLGGLPDDFGQSESSPTDSNSFPEIPGYIITRLLAQGGMGAVYEATWHSTTHVDSAASPAEDGPSPSTRVALKTISLHRFQTVPPTTRERFQREIELLGSFEHPNIVPLLDHGSYLREFQMVPYFSMPLLDQGDLADALEQTPITTRKDLKVWIDRLGGVLEGLALAHRSGIVHRDIKPRNLFVAADDRLMLGDFGLAKILEGDSELTSTIGHMGTTPYAPPEQLLSAKLADARADIYAMGVILHQLACHGLRPFAPENLAETSSSSAKSSETDSIARWQRSSERIPPKPSARQKHLSDRSLDFIIQKCLAYLPEHRYQSADDLASDLRRWQQGEVIRGTWSEQFRNRWVPYVKANLIPIACAACLLIATASWFGWNRYATLSQDVTSLQKNIEGERQKRLQSEETVEAKLRSQLATLLPRLEGEPQDYLIRRFPNPEAEFNQKQQLAQKIATELGLRQSTQFSDRHHAWVIDRTSVPPSLSDGGVYVQHIHQLINETRENLRIAQSSGNAVDQADALSDHLRTYRMLLSLAWRIEEAGAREDYRNIIDSQVVIRDCTDRLKSIQATLDPKSSPALSRHVSLMLLEIDAHDPAKTPAQIIDFCSQRRAEFSADRLKTDGCTQLHPWYIAWYLCEHLYETANDDTDRTKVPLMPIVDQWHQITTARPAVDKKQNLTYVKDLLVVEDRRGDVLRKLGQIEDAREQYEKNWQESERMRTNFPSDSKIWDISSQTISSLLVLTEQEKDIAGLVNCYRRKQILLREQLTLAKESPHVFDQRDQRFATQDLVTALYRHAKLLAPQEREPLLSEARTTAEAWQQTTPDPKLNQLLQKIDSLPTN